MKQHRSDSKSVNKTEASVKGASSDVELVDKLNEILANQYVLFTKTLNYHWNVVGREFIAIHEFLDDQYHDLLKMMDELAERIRYLNARPVSTVREVEEDANISEEPGYYPDMGQMLADLCDDHDLINKQMEALQENFVLDSVTEDIVVGLQGKHQNMLWMLRSHLEGPKSEVRSENFRLN